MLLLKTKSKRLFNIIQRRASKGQLSIFPANRQRNQIRGIISASNKTVNVSPGAHGIQRQTGCPSFYNTGSFTILHGDIYRNPAISDVDTPASIQIRNRDQQQYHVFFSPQHLASPNPVVVNPNSTIAVQVPPLQKKYPVTLHAFCPGCATNQSDSIGLCP